MPKNDEGEFELVLGNRQLISVFVIVVALLGVFFSFGYIVGRNSSPVAASEAAKSNSDAHAAEPTSTDGSVPGALSDGAAQPSATNSAGDEPARSQAPPSATQPERPSAAAQAKENKPKPFSDREAIPERALPGQLAAGQYWQVVATTRPDAEIIAEALDRKGFHAVLAPAPKDGMFRVLVGPLADAATQAQARTNLEAAGFKNPIMRKY